MDVFESYTGRFLHGGPVDPTIRLQIKDVVVVCVPQTAGPELLEKLEVLKKYRAVEFCLRVVTDAPEGKQVQAGWRQIPDLVEFVSDRMFDCFGENVDCGPPGVSED